MTWGRVVTLADIGTWGSGGTPKSTQGIYYGGEIPWIRSGDLPDAPIVQHTATITKQGFDNSSAKWVETGAVLIALYGATIGKLAITTYPVTTNQAVAYCVPDTSLLSPEFLFWFLLSKRSELVALGHGGAQPNISQSILKKLQIMLPSLDQQRRIVSKLENLFARSRSAREEIVRITGLIERNREAILGAAYSGELTTSWRKERGLPAPLRTTIDRIVASPIRNGLSVRGSDFPPGVRSLRLSALRNGEVDLQDVRFLPISASKSEKYLLEDNDVLISRGNGTKKFVGLAALVQSLSDPTIFPDTAFRIRLATESARPRWFTTVWNAPQVRMQIESVAKTTAGIWKISQGDLARIEIYLPSPEEQDEIVRRIAAHSDRLTAVAYDVTRSAALLDRLDQAVLAKGFRGELGSHEEPVEKARETVAAE